MNTAARPAPHTPLPEENRANESKLTFKPSEKPWVKLSEIFADIDGFAAGQIVQIYGVVPSYTSPSAPGLNESEWIPTESDALYRFQKRCIRVQYGVAELKAVPHRKLHTTPTTPGKPGTYQARGRYPSNSVVYLAEAMQVRWGNKTLDVKKGTAVTISDAISKTGRAADKISTNVNPESMYYVVLVYIETLQAWTTRTCKQGRHGNNFRPLSDEENDAVQKNLSRVLDTTPRVVSVIDSSLLEQMQSHATQLRDVAMLQV